MFLTVSGAVHPAPASWETICMKKWVFEALRKRAGLKVYDNLPVIDVSVINKASQRAHAVVFFDAACLPSGAQKISLQKYDDPLSTAQSPARLD
jgi:hypothetical protein